MPLGGRTVMTSMANDKFYEGRIQGMYYAYERIKKDGIEEFEKELVFRQAFGVKALVKLSEMHDLEMRIVKRVQDVVLVFSLLVLHDEFGFGKKRIRQFMARYNDKCGRIADEYTTWDEQVQIIKDELDIDFEFR